MARSPKDKELQALKRKIGRNLNYHRTRQRLTLEKLGKKTHFTPHLIDGYELGKRDMRLQNLLRLTKALNIAIDDLFA